MKFIAIFSNMNRENRIACYILVRCIEAFQRSTLISSHIKERHGSHVNVAKHINIMAHLLLYSIQVNNINRIKYLTSKLLYLANSTRQRIVVSCLIQLWSGKVLTAIGHCPMIHSIGFFFQKRKCFLNRKGAPWMRTNWMSWRIKEPHIIDLFTWLLNGNCLATEWLI